MYLWSMKLIPKYNNIRTVYFWINTFIIFHFFLACNTNSIKEVETKSKFPLIGSWEMSSIYWITDDTTYSIESAQPGLLMIGANRYSIMWTPIDQPRKPFKSLSKPTDEEMKTGFRSIVFNAGLYEKTDSTLTTTAQIAKVPGFEDGKQYYRYNIKDDILELTMFDETYPDGQKPEWFGKFVTKFILKKVK